MPAGVPAARAQLTSAVHWHSSGSSLSRPAKYRAEYSPFKHVRSTQMNHAEMQFLTTEFPYKKQYGNSIGGEWVKPVGGEYFDNVSPITGEPFTSIPRSREADIELALDAAHRAKVAWGKTSTTDRANILNRIADRMEANLQRIAVAETIDKVKLLA